MMKTTKSSRPQSEEKKQKQPMPGETSPKDAFIKARQFAAQEKSRLKKGR